MFIEKIAIFFLFLGPLVFFHELGHFLFARLFGVKVEVFSIGFGPKIFRKKMGDTEYALSLIPLGGYVKMFGDDPLSEDPLSDEEKAVAFTHKSKWAKFWIVFGGPLANFIFAYVIYFLLVFSGENVPQVRFGIIPESTTYHELGYRSGDILKKLNQQEITSFDDLNLIDSKLSSITIERENKDITLPVNVTGMEFIQDYSRFSSQLRAPVVAGVNGKRYFVSANAETPEYKSSLEEIAGREISTIFLIPITQMDQTSTKLEQFEIDTKNVKMISLDSKVSLVSQLMDQNFYPLDLMIKSIVMSSPAEKAGLKGGQIIYSIDGKRLESFEDLRAQVQAIKSGAAADVVLIQGSKKITTKMTPEFKMVAEQKVLTIGVYSGVMFLPMEMVESKAKGLLDSFSKAFYRTKQGIIKTMAGFKKLITAEVSVSNIGGPIAIGKVASDSFNISLSMFFRLMAIISINLGIINLFPIPVLDGGHIVFLILEVINRGPLSKKKVQLAQQFGMSFLFLLIFVALFNDLSRLF